MMFVKLAIGLAILAIGSCKLIFVNEMYRHGARGTQKSVKNIWDSESPFNTQWKEELSPTGMRQHYTYGKAVREEYIEQLKFLSPTMNFDEIYVSCTQFNRTLQSALSHLYGMYPPQSGLEMNDLVADEDKLPPFKGSKQPEYIHDNRALPNFATIVPIHVNSALVYYPPDTCPNYNNIAKNWRQEHSDLQKKINEEYKLTFESLQTLLNYDKPIDLSNAELIWDILIADLNNGQPLPEGMTQDVWKNITQLDTLDWYFNQFGDWNSVAIQNKPTFQYWQDNFDQAIENQKDTSGKTHLKWAMISGHDNNMAGAMVGLGFTDLQCNLDNFWKGNNDALNCNMRPYFAASILLELHEIDGKYYVAGKYDGTYQNLCGERKKYCLYSEFKEKVFKPNLISEEDQAKACKVQQNNNNLRQSYVSFLQNQDSNSGFEGKQQWVYYAFGLVCVGIVVGIFVKRQSRKGKLNLQFPKFTSYKSIDLDSNLHQNEIVDL